MKFLKFQFFALFFLFYSIYTGFAQSTPVGIELCNSLYEYLFELNLDVEKSEFISSPDNNFPYNITLNFNNLEQDSSDNLILCMKMESAWNNKDLVFDLISDLKYRNFNSTIIFIYGSGVTLPRRIAVSGAMSFTSKLDTSKSYTAFILNLDSQENTIQTGSMGRTSPSWIVNATYDAYMKEKLGDDLPMYYLSQISKMGFTSDQLFTSFSFRDIPCIAAGFNTQQVSKNQIYNVVSNFLDSYSDNKHSLPDYHSLIFKFGNHKIFLSEYTIVRIWIVITLLSLFFIYILAFINKSVRNTAWHQIKNNWYTIPTIYGLTLFGFFVAKGIYQAYTKNGELAVTAFGLPVLGITLASFLVFGFFIAEITFHKASYSEKSVDYLIVITTFVNQFLFCLTDISLFPLFMVLCFLSILSILLKRNWFHILLFVFMIGSYFPYIFQLYSSTQSSSLRIYFLRGNSSIFGMAFIVLPIYLMWFRIQTAIRKRFTKTKVFLIINTSVFVFLITVGIILNTTVFFDPSKRSEPVVLKENINPDYNIIQATYSDRKVFEDTLRTITIHLTQDSVYTSVRVIGQDGNPVLYSQYDMYQFSNSASFQIPSYPPKDMSFTYGTAYDNSTIEIESIVQGEDKNQFTSYKTILTTGEK